MNGCFDVRGVELHGKSFGLYHRGEAKAFPRRLELDCDLLKQMQLAASASNLSKADRRIQLRKYAAFVAITLAHEAGGHALHSMVRPLYFFDDDMKLKLDNQGRAVYSPPRKFSGVPTYDVSDLGTCLEHDYFGRYSSHDYAN